jgi:hypothetical protein
MTEMMVNYLIFWLLIALIVFSIVIWIEKMIKIILWNYILSSICLATSQSINLLVNQLALSPEIKTLWILNSKLSQILSDGQTTIILIIYIILLVIIYHKSKIKIDTPDDETTKKLIHLLLVPLTVVSIIITFQTVLMWINIVNIQSIQSIANSISTNPYLFKFISWTPLWILLHWLATIVITSELKISIKTNI